MSKFNKIAVTIAVVGFLAALALSVAGESAASKAVATVDAPFVYWGLFLLFRGALRRGSKLRERHTSGPGRAPVRQRGREPEPSRASWPPPAPGRQRTPTPPTQRRCTWHHNKVIFATETEARGSVELSQRRYAAGDRSHARLDHAYKCPLLTANHWHVTKQPRR